MPAGDVSLGLSMKRISDESGDQNGCVQQPLAVN
jgi:hypothetical protein